MDRSRLLQLADELEAIFPKLAEEGLLLGLPGGRLADRTPLVAAGEMIVEAIEAGGLQSAEYAAFRTAIRVISAAPQPDWARVLREGQETLPLPEIIEGRGKHWISVVPYVVGQLRQEAETSDEDPKIPEPDPKLLMSLRGKSRELLQYLWRRGLVGREELRQDVWKDSKAADKTIDAAIDYLNQKLSEKGYRTTRVEKSGGTYYLRHPEK